MNEDKAVLVTGGAGFIGAHVAARLLKNGYRVTIFDDLSGGFEENIPKRAEFIKGSVTNKHLVDDLFCNHNFQYVFHLAAYAAEGLSHFIRNFNYNNNVIGSINIINSCIRQEVKCLVFTSSIAVYGPAQTPMSESTIPQPEDPYGIAKYAIEMDMAAAHRMFGLNYVIFRPHNVYGELQNIGDKYRNVIGIFINQIMNGQPMTIFGDGLQTRAFSHIDDVAPVIADSIKNPDAYGEIFNVGADKPYTVLEVAEEVACAFQVEPKIKYLEPRKEVVHAFSTHKKVRDFFGHEPTVDLSRGISRMVNWAKQLGQPRQGEKFGNLELQRNLPPAWK